MWLKIIRDLIFMAIGACIIINRMWFIEFSRQWYLKFSWIHYGPIQEKISFIILWILGITCIGAGLFDIIKLLITKPL